MLNLSNGNAHCPLALLFFCLPIQRSIKSTFDKAIGVLKLASRSWTDTSKYDWSTYETQQVVAEFTELEREIEGRYKMLKVRFGVPLAPMLRDAKPCY